MATVGFKGLNYFSCNHWSRTSCAHFLIFSTDNFAVRITSLVCVSICLCVWTFMCVGQLKTSTTSSRKLGVRDKQCLSLSGEQQQVSKGGFFIENSPGCHVTVKIPVQIWHNYTTVPLERSWR